MTTMITERNGLVRALRDGELIPDGARLTVKMMLMDGIPMAALHDGMGRPAGFGPGYCFPGPATTVADARAIADRTVAYDGYVRDLEGAWKTPAPPPLPDTTPAQKTRPAASLADLAAPERARVDYERRLVNGWRSA